MIYVTGDLHGSQEIDKLQPENFPEGQKLNKDDFLIVLGDFGLIWHPLRPAQKRSLWNPNPPPMTEQEEYWLRFLSEQPYTTLFLDGNHENFDRLLAYPMKDFHGGRASQIHDTVWYLRRGEIFNLCGKSCFVLGGAQSIDMIWRTPGQSWWPQEVPSHEDYKNAQKNLRKYNDAVDFVFTHTCPESIKRQLPLDGEWSNVAEKMKFVDRTEGMLEGFLAQIKFEKWYFAHFHLDHITERFISVYNSILRVA